MFDYYDYTDLGGTSPTNSSVLAQGSELFKAVMEDFIQEHQLTKNGTRDMNTNTINGFKTTPDLCKRCPDTKSSYKRSRERTSTRTVHHVQWADEICDGQLARELQIDRSSPLSCSPPSDYTDSLKPILKHKANCIIIVAE